jgi:hypothetical protein
MISSLDTQQFKWVPLASKNRILPYIFGSLAIVILVLRIFEMLSRSRGEFIEVGLFSDRLCHLGSYEMFVCTDYLPPYETLLVILAIMLVSSLWVIQRKRSQ